jgi:hypothetical protein
MNQHRIVKIQADVRGARSLERRAITIPPHYCGDTRKHIAAGRRSQTIREGCRRQGSGDRHPIHHEARPRRVTNKHHRGRVAVRQTDRHAVVRRVMERATNRRVVPSRDVMSSANIAPTRSSR